MIPSPASSSPPRLLVLAQPEIARAAPWPPALPVDRCEFCPDLYALAARLAAPDAPLTGLLLDPRRLPPHTLDLLALLQQHRPLPLWFLDPPSPAVRPIVEQLLRRGAKPLDPARALSTSQLPRTPATNGHAVSHVAPTPPPAPPAAPTNAPRVEGPVPPAIKTQDSELSTQDSTLRTSIPAPVAKSAPAAPRQIPESPKKTLASASDQFYDSLTAESTLTEAEMRALLGPDL